MSTYRYDAADQLLLLANLWAGSRCSITHGCDGTRNRSTTISIDLTPKVLMQIKVRRIAKNDSK